MYLENNATLKEALNHDKIKMYNSHKQTHFIQFAISNNFLWSDEIEESVSKFSSSRSSSSSSESRLGRLSSSSNVSSDDLVVVSILEKCLKFVRRSDCTCIIYHGPGRVASLSTPTSPLCVLKHIYKSLMSHFIKPL